MYLLFSPVLDWASHTQPNVESLNVYSHNWVSCVSHWVQRLNASFTYREYFFSSVYESLIPKLNVWVPAVLDAGLQEAIAQLLIGLLLPSASPCAPFDRRAHHTLLQLGPTPEFVFFVKFFRINGHNVDFQSLYYIRKFGYYSKNYLHYICPMINFWNFCCFTKQQGKLEL